MFDTLFRYPGVLARHRDGPSSHERELFLTHCACMGTSHPTLLCLASELLLVARYLDLSDNRLINPQEIEVACSRWVRHQRRLRRIRVRRTAGSGSFRSLQTGSGSWAASYLHRRSRLHLVR
jgi:integrase/recombinase XerD